MKFDEALIKLREGHKVRCILTGNIYKLFPHMQTSRPSLYVLFKDDKYTPVEKIYEYEIMSNHWSVVE